MRAKDDEGKLLPPPHQRLPNASVLIQAGYFALANDGRSTIWTADQKISICKKVIDHIFDGDAIPKRFFKNDRDGAPAPHLIELWRTAEKGVRGAMRAT